MKDAKPRAEFPPAKGARANLALSWSTICIPGLPFSLPLFRIATTFRRARGWHPIAFRIFKVKRDLLSSYYCSRNKVIINKMSHCNLWQGRSPPEIILAQQSGTDMPIYRLLKANLEWAREGCFCHIEQVLLILDCSQGALSESKWWTKQNKKEKKN